MTRAIVVAILVAGYLLAHVVAYVAEHGRAWWRRYSDTKWRELMIAQGKLALRWIDGRGKRRAQQREWAHGQMLMASARPENRSLPRRKRRAATRILTADTRARASKQGELKP